MKQGSNRARLLDTFARATARPASGLEEQRCWGDRSRKAHQQDATPKGWAIAAPSPRARPNLRRLSASRPSAKGNVAPRAFVPGAVEDLANDVNELTRHIEAEVVLESGLHVPGAAAGGCYERFGLPSEVAPPLVSPLQASRGGEPGQDTDDAVELAVCLATPSEDEGRGGMREAVTRALDDLARQGEIRSEIQNILNSMEELEMGSKRGRGDPSAPLRPTRRATTTGDSIEFDADTVEGYERTVEGNVVELRVNTIRRRLVEAG